MNQFVEGAVKANQIYHHYWRSTPAAHRSLLSRLRRSKPRPALLLLHAATESGACWAQAAAALRLDYDVIATDARGHGLSEAPETGYGIEERANDVICLIEALELGRPVLIGHALGAETAVAAAGLRPDLVRGIILEDPPWPGRFWGSTVEERSERAERWRAEILRDKGRSGQELTGEGREKHPGWGEEELAAWAAARQQVSPHLTSLVFAPRRRWSDYLREAACPLLLITGEAERGATVTQQTAREAAAYWQNGRAVQINGAGHHIHREQLKPYLRAVKEFLKQV